MGEYLPLLILGAIIGLFSTAFLCAYAVLKRSKPKDFDRHMKDSEIIRRLAYYAKPYTWQFILALVITLISIVYDLLSPLIVGYIEEVVAGEFELHTLYVAVALYGSMLLVSMVCTYVKTMMLQKIGRIT